MANIHKAITEIDIQSRLIKYAQILAAANQVWPLSQINPWWPVGYDMIMLLVVLNRKRILSNPFFVTSCFIHLFNEVLPNLFFKDTLGDSWRYLKTDFKIHSWPPGKFPLSVGY